MSEDVEDDADTSSEEIAIVDGNSYNEVEIPREVMIDIYPNDIELWLEKIDGGFRCYW